MTAAVLAELRGVSRRFAEVEVLRDIDLEINSGESMAVVGPSGSGKSTLLNLLGGLLPPSAGTVLFEGRDLSTLGADQLATFRNTEIGYVFQTHHLLPQCSALENVLIPTLVRKDPADRNAAVERASHLLEVVGLAARRGHRPSQLSGGECQRVAVVRALINRPRLLLADEPTGSLDAKASDQIGELLCKLNETESVALLTVTHSDKLARRMGRMFELQDGRLAPT